MLTEFGVAEVDPSKCSEQVLTTSLSDENRMLPERISSVYFFPARERKDFLFPTGY